MVKDVRDIKIGKHTITIGNEQKILFPKSKITKGELIDYYRRIAPTMLPYLKNRSLTMQRFVDGIGEEGFYQKDASAYFPSWIKRKKVKRQDDGFVNYVVCNDAATLVYLANQVSITNHVWLSKIDKLRYPDRMIFDLDPSKKNDFKRVKQAAKDIKILLESLGLVSFVMTTGSRGLHVVVPLKRTENFTFVRTFARDVADYMAFQNPKVLTTEIRKNKRRGRIFVDWLRNSFGATGVAPYSVRPKEGAPVATPLTWKELDNPKLAPDKYTIKNIFARLSKMGDPFKGIEKRTKSLKKARNMLDKLVAE